MRIEQLREGKIVGCPSDMGQDAYKGVIESWNTVIHKTLQGNEFVWVTVKDINSRMKGRKSVWPSHRLG